MERIPFSSGVDTIMPVLLYRPGRHMPCPSCGGRHWLVGRMMAQCAVCDAALPLDTGYRGWSLAIPKGLRSRPAA